MYDLNHIYKVGNLISRLREQKGLTQSELGVLLGVTNKAVSKWENGRGYPDTSLLLNLSNILGITVDELLKGELITSTQTGKIINDDINYLAEKSLFIRFLLTLIPFVICVMWIGAFFMDPFNWGSYLSYGEMMFVGIILPVILLPVANLILGLFFVLKINKRKDIKISIKVLISIATFIGFGLYYIVIFLYMLIRFLKVKNKLRKQ